MKWQQPAYDEMAVTCLQRNGSNLRIMKWQQPAYDEMAATCQKRKGSNLRIMT